MRGAGRASAFLTRNRRATISAGRRGALSPPRRAQHTMTKNAPHHHHRPLRDRVHYAVDNFLARGSGALFLSLALAFVGAVVLFSLMRVAAEQLAPDTSASAIRHVWLAFLELTDPGNMSQDITTPPVFKPVAVLTGMTGVVIFSALIAFLASALNEALARLREGLSPVNERGQTMVLGWGPRVSEILDELAIAKESDGGGVVVVVADEDKAMMDEQLRTQFTRRRGTRVVTRSGSPSLLATLSHASASTARSAVILASCDLSVGEEARRASDAMVVKSVLALQAQVGRDAGLDIVAEVFFARNRDVVTSMAPGHVVAVDAEEILARIMVQTSRTSGLGVVYAELLSFDGCEMYFHRAAWGGVTFGEALLHFVDGVPIAVLRAGGELEIKPDPGYRLAEGDELVIVAEDDSSIQFSSSPAATSIARQLPARRRERQHERMLLLGWDAKAPSIIREYASYVLEGSEVCIVIAGASAQLREAITRLSASVPQLRIRLLEEDPLLPGNLERIDPFSFHNVLVLRQNLDAGVSAERLDSDSVVVLLQLRRLRGQGRTHEGVETKLITEVLDSRNQELFSQAGVNDFIVSNRMVSMVLAQLSEEPRMKQVYDNLFAEAGSEIYVKPASLYFDELPVTCTYADLIGLANQRDGEVCLGYKLAHLGQDASRNFGVELIPPKDASVTLSPGDALVVVAEDDC
jgi:ion channel POLLUX/CASTOR